MQKTYKHIILLIAFYLWVTSCWAQTPIREHFSKDYVLTSNAGLGQPGTDVFLAQKTVSFKPGFKFTAVSNASLQAKINELILAPSHYYPYINEDADGHPYNRVLDTSLEVGSIYGEAHVNSSGTGFYTIPIELPDAPSALVPELSIIYNTAGGNGILGHSFALSGISKISLAPKDIYHDGTTQGIADGNNTYSLDGNRLISDSYGEEFYTEQKTEGVTIYKKGGSNPYFEMNNAKENKRFEYGRINNSRNGIFWSIDKITDRFGNTIEYFYKPKIEDLNEQGWEYVNKNKHTNDECILEKIVYGGGNEILFTYSLRDDHLHFKFGGNYTSLQSGSSVLLNEIEIRKSTGEVYAIYEFKYIKNSMGLSCLLEIKKKNGQGGELNPTLFHWKDPNTFNLSQKTINRTIPAFNKDTDFVGDFNNDGRSDILIKTGTQTYSLYEFDAAGNVSQRNLNFTGELLCVGDYNGDGHVDILAYRNSKCMLLNINSSDFNIVEEISCYIKPCKVAADFDQDGKTDVFIYTQNGLEKYSFETNNGLKFEQRIVSDTIVIKTISYSFGGEITSILTGDFDGNGYNDCVINGCIYGYSNGSEYTWSIERDYYISPNGAKYVDIFGAFDTNNDGQLELLQHDPVECEQRIDYWDLNDDSDFDDEFIIEYYRYVTYDSQTGEKTQDQYHLISCSPNIPNDNLEYLRPFMDDKGELTSSYEQVYYYRKTVAEYQIDYSPCQESYMNCGKIDIGRSEYVDVNGDGTPEYLIYNEPFQIPYLVRAHPKSGMGPIIQQIATNGAIAGDFNGDGATEFIKGNILYYSPYPTAATLEGVVDGHNNKVLFTYSRILDQKDPNDANRIRPTYPYATMTGPFHVVSKVTKHIDGYFYETNYTYSDSRIHLNGKGFLGFSKFVKTDEFTETTASIEQFNDKHAIPLKTYEAVKYLHKEGGTTLKSLISETSTELILEELTPVICYTIKEQKTTHTDLDGNKTKTELLFDTRNGILEKETVTKYSSNDVAFTKVTCTYSNPTADGFKNPQTITTNYSRHDVTNSIELQVKNTYYSNGLLKTTEDRGLKKEYTYDTKGNITTLKTSADDMAAQTDRYEYSNGMYPTRHINALSQSTTKKYDTWGNVTEETDLRGKTTYHTYNAWGRLLSTQTPDGLTYTYEKKRADNYAPQGAYCYTAVYKNNTLTEKDYYNLLGQNIRNISIGKKGKQLYTDKTYDRRGNMIRCSEPYTSTGQANLFTLYEYKDTKAGRLSKETGPNITTQIIYGINTITTKTEKDYVVEVFTKEYDASGFLKYATDNGGRIEYFATADNQLTKIQSPGGRITEIEYDANRRKSKLKDADAGETEYTYYKNGNIKTQTNANGKITTYTYDALNRVKTEICDGITYTYTYDGVNARGLLSGIKSNSPRKEEEIYKYDTGGLGRLTERTRKDIDKQLTFKYTYDNRGHIISQTYPDNFKVTYLYNVYDDLLNIRNAADNSIIWELADVNTQGQKTKVNYGNGKQITYQYDSYHRLVGVSAPQIINFTYEFNDRQQLVSRHEQYWNESTWAGFRENFTYDNVNRLKTSSINGVEKMRMEYSTNGTNNQIWSKTGTGREFQYNYGIGYPVNSKLKEFIPADGYTPPNHTMTYTSRLKLESIQDTTNTRSLHINYGIDNQRFRQVYHNGNDSTVTWYMDGYEEITLPGSMTRKLNYVFAEGELVGINVQSNDVHNGMHYIYTDYLGSVRCITNAAGSIEHSLSFDAWGSRRNPYTGTLLNENEITVLTAGLTTQRGFTGHEHLDAFGYINMNGRVYDPAISMFLSPDPYIQAPDFTQNFNRYTYCLNNPFMYTDPSGEIAWFIPVIIGTVVGAYTGASIQSGTAAFWEWKPDAWKGAIAGAFIGATTGGMFSAAMGATGMTTAAANTATASAVKMWGVTSSIVNSASINIGINAISGGGWDEAWKAGLVGAATGAWVSTGGFGIVKGFGKTSLGKISGKLAYQMIGTAGRSIGNNWAQGDDPFSKVTLGVGPVNLTLGREQNLLRWQNNLGNIAMNAFGLGNLAFGGKVNFDWKNLSLNYTGGIVNKFYKPQYWAAGFGAHAVIGNDNLSKLYSHELHHLWQSRASGDTYLLNYGLQGIQAALMGGFFIKNCNYFETQADGGFWW